MAYIKVDYSKFERASSSIDAYTVILKNKMSQAQNEILGLAFTWQGADYIQVKSQFDKVDNSDSTHYKMVESLESYSKFLRYVSQQYKDAQSRAVNRANNLPIW